VHHSIRSKVVKFCEKYNVALVMDGTAYYKCCQPRKQSTSHSTCATFKTKSIPHDLLSKSLSPSLQRRNIFDIALSNNFQIDGQHNCMCQTDHVTPTWTQCSKDFQLKCRVAHFPPHLFATKTNLRHTLKMLDQSSQCVLERKRRFRLLNVATCTQSPTGPLPCKVIGNKEVNR
jgi:hypothetical protein